MHAVCGWIEGSNVVKKCNTESSSEVKCSHTCCPLIKGKGKKFFCQGYT